MYKWFDLNAFDSTEIGLKNKIKTKLVHSCQGMISAISETSCAGMLN